MQRWNCHDQLHWESWRFAGLYAIGLIKDKTGSLHWGLAFVGISMLVPAIFLMLLPKRARTQSS
jgi:MFS-type transporter involved in bile tolerance (Atg22 family)